MTQYSICNVSDHILIVSGGDLLLVDTGSPSSFHQSGQMTLCEETFPVPKSLMGVDADYISRQLHVSVKGLIGMDYISVHPMSLDVSAGLLTFDCDETGWIPLKSATIPGAVLLTINVCGKPANVILDTGAPVSYISPKFTAGREPLCTVNDFSPFHSTGTFETEVFSLPCSIAGQDFYMRLGNLPEGLGMMLSMLGADGAVGMDMLRHFKVLISEGMVSVSGQN